MPKRYEKIGFEITSNDSPGIWASDILERNYYVDVLKNSMRWSATENVNSDILIGNQFSIIADSYAYENIGVMKYITYMNTKWSITNIEVQYPRIIISVGGVYVK